MAEPHIQHRDSIVEKFDPGQFMCQKHQALWWATMEVELAKVMEWEKAAAVRDHRFENFGELNLDLHAIESESATFIEDGTGNLTYLCADCERLRALAR